MLQLHEHLLEGSGPRSVGCSSRRSPQRAARIFIQCLNAISSRLPDGTRRLHNAASVPITHDHNTFRAFSAAAMARPAIYRAAVMMHVLACLATVGILTTLRLRLREFLENFLRLASFHGWKYDISYLHQPADIRPPYITLEEHTELRLALKVFTAYGRTKVVRIINQVLSHHIPEPNIVAHFLFAGMLDPNDEVGFYDLLGVTPVGRRNTPSPSHPRSFPWASFRELADLSHNSILTLPGVVRDRRSITAGANRGARPYGSAYHAPARPTHGAAGCLSHGTRGCDALHLAPTSEP
ncbi:hypothetical protein DFH06DRAFT_1195689 [Mycena polygramma]|nr:hypothetical protein DFH06DRAFT_1195689 [Mycena polygramma]